MAEPDVTADAFLGGHVTVFQTKKGFRAGTDSVLLAAALDAEQTGEACEFGCGAGGALFPAAWRLKKANFTGLEADPLMLDLARRGLAENGFGERVQLLQQDIGNLRHKPRDEDTVIGAPLRPAEIAIALPDGQIADIQADNLLPGDIRQAVEAFDAENIRAKLPGERRRVAGTRADHEGAGLFQLPDIQRLQQLACHRRARDDLAARDRQDTILEGQRLQLGAIDESAPVDRFHCLKYGIVGHALLPETQDKARGAERVGDQLFHVSRSVLRNTSCVKSTWRGDTET